MFLHRSTKSVAIHFAFTSRYLRISSSKGVLTPSPIFGGQAPFFSIDFPRPGLHTAAGRNLKKLYQPPYVPRVQSSGSLRASGGGSSISREAFCPLKNRSKPKSNMVSQPFFQGIARLRECIFGRLMMSEVRLWFLFLFGWVR